MSNNGKKVFGRRHFVQSSIGLISGMAIAPAMAFANTPAANAEEVNIIGPREGYSPVLGTFVSMLTWMTESVYRAVKDIKKEELDFLMDPKANSIGALLSHLAATEVIYQDLTFNNLQDFSDVNKKRWNVAMNLGDDARKQIKNNSLDYYVANLKEVREKTLAEFKKKDDNWLAQVDPHFFGNQPTNNYCKWFHVCEHIGNHRGQIALIRKRIPGSNSTD